MSETTTKVCPECGHISEQYVLRIPLSSTTKPEDVRVELFTLPDYPERPDWDAYAKSFRTVVNKTLPTGFVDRVFK